MGWSDEEIVLFIREYGSKKWVMYSLMALLGALLLLNYWMRRRLQRTRKQHEVHVDWTDAEDEVEVRLSLPAVVTASDIRVEVQHSYLKIFMKMGSTGKWEAKPLMEVELAMPRRRATATLPLVPPPSAPADHLACSQGKLFKLIKSSETTWYVGESSRTSNCTEEPRAHAGPLVPRVVMSPGHWLSLTHAAWQRAGRSRYSFKSSRRSTGSNCGRTRRSSSRRTTERGPRTADASSKQLSK